MRLPSQGFARSAGQRTDHWREDRIAVAPKRLLSALDTRPVELAVACQLGDQAFERERGSIHLKEALLDYPVSVLASYIGEYRIGRSASARSAAAAAVE